MSVFFCSFVLSCQSSFFDLFPFVRGVCLCLWGGPFSKSLQVIFPDHCNLDCHAFESVVRIPFLPVLTLLISFPLSTNTMSSVEMSDVKSLQALVRKRAGFLRGLVGLAADFRCGVCFKLASDHVGGVITDCCDKEMPEDQLLASLQSQLSSIDGLVSRLDMLSVQSGQVARLTAEADEYRSIVDEKDALLQAKEAELAASQERVVECNAELASRDDEIAGLRSEKLVWRSEKDSLTESVCEGVCSIWRSYLGGASAESVVGRLRSEFDYTVPLSSFPTSPTSLNTPTSAADTSPSAASASNSPASSLPATTNPASSSSASTDADGDKVGKSTKIVDGG